MRINPMGTHSSSTLETCSTWGTFPTCPCIATPANSQPRTRALSRWSLVWIGCLGLGFLGLVMQFTPSVTAEEPTPKVDPKAAPKADPKPAATKWKSLFDGKSLKNWKSSQFGGEGEVVVKDGTIIMSQGSEMTGIVWDGGELPKMNYEISLSAQRIDGGDFFCGLTFQVNEDPCSFIVGGWGGGLVGISSLDGQDAANNETARFESFHSKRWYKIRLRVSEKGLMGWIDDKQVVGVETKDRKISIRPEVDLSRPLGIACFATVAGLKDIQIRNLTPAEAKAPITPAAVNAE